MSRVASARSSSRSAARPTRLAAEGLGVGPWRLLRRHLLPASYGFLVTQATLLIPGFILAEATLSFVGLGFVPAPPRAGV